jgi:hypothetical protein
MSREETVLIVDYDGDGETDATWTARENETVTAADSEEAPEPGDGEGDPEPGDNDETTPEPGSNDETSEPGNDGEFPEPGNADETPEPGDNGEATPEPGDPGQANPPRTSPGNANGGSGFSSSTPERVDGEGEVTYIAGPDRIATAVAISRQGWKKADAVILASGADASLIDAALAAPLAGQEDAPILLSVQNSLEPSVIAEIRRLGAMKVYAVGALSRSVTDELRAALPGIEIEHLKGRDRWETASLISAKIENPQGVFVVGADALADAVSAAPFAAANGYVIQPARPDGAFELDYPLTANRYILGGPALVRDIPGYTRIYGADRYATNKALIEALPFEHDNIYFADGHTLVDALTGAALAARSEAAVILVAGNRESLNFAPAAGSKIYALGSLK